MITTINALLDHIEAWLSEQDFVGPDEARAYIEDLRRRYANGEDIGLRLYNLGDMMGWDEAVSSTRNAGLAPRPGARKFTDEQLREGVEKWDRDHEKRGGMNFALALGFGCGIDAVSRRMKKLSL